MATTKTHEMLAHLNVDQLRQHLIEAEEMYERLQALEADRLSNFTITSNADGYSVCWIADGEVERVASTLREAQRLREDLDAWVEQGY